jgi:hypothetical protein
MLFKQVISVITRTLLDCYLFAWTSSSSMAAVSILIDLYSGVWLI